MGVKITFLGASGTVTGSKYLVEGSRARVIIDAGLFQGEREWRERNWDEPPFDLQSISAVLLTHAHIDHSGILPRWGATGLRAPVYCTQATQHLCRVMLPDSGRLQEEEANFRGKYKRSRHTPPLPLYTEQDAEAILRSFRPVQFDSSVEIAPGISATWRRMGHILGAASISLTVDGRLITFSGDVGRYQVPILRDPVAVDFGDLLLIESTYGDRDHEVESPSEELRRVVNESVSRKGLVLIPAFAVGRTQLILFYLRELKEKRAIPDIPIIVDSPMAQDATEIYRANPSCYDEESLGILSKGTHPFEPSKLFFTKSVEESKRLNTITDPMIIIAGSGMLSGGRILHHLRHRVSSPLTTVLFVGHQPTGGRGDWMIQGKPTMRLLGEDVDIRAKVETISGLSAHGGRSELLRWCRESRGKPTKVAVVHGEKEVARAFAETLVEEFSWDAKTPHYKETWNV